MEDWVERLEKCRQAVALVEQADLLESPPVARPEMRVLRELVAWAESVEARLARPQFGL